MGREVSVSSSNNKLDKPDRLHRYRGLNKFLSIFPYRTGALIISIAIRIPLLRLVAQKHSKRLRSLMNEQGIELDENALFSRYLVNNWFSNWRLLALSRCTDQEFKRWVSLSGYEAFKQLREQGRPVLLCNSHYGSGKVILLALMRLGHTIYSLDRKDVFSHSNIRAHGNLISINLGERESNFMLKQVFRARKVLADGGVLHIAGDGMRGLSGRAIPFLGRQRRFPASVAELALATNAVVVPTFGMIETDGHVKLELLSPIEMPSVHLSHDERIMSIIEQYRDLLQERWTTCPGSIHKSELKIYYSLPRTDLLKK